MSIIDSDTGNRILSFEEFTTIVIIKFKQNLSVLLRDKNIKKKKLTLVFVSDRTCNGNTVYSGTKNDIRKTRGGLT